MRTSKFLCKINVIMLYMLFFWITMPDGHGQAGQQSFTVQVMSGSDKEAASRFVEKLIQNGFDAFIAELPGKEKTLYKVQVGNFTHRKDAAQLHEALRIKGIDGWITQVLEVPAQAPHDEHQALPVPPEPHEAATARPPEAVSAPVADEKPFVLIINPVPTFSEEKTTVAAAREQPAGQPEKTYKYFNPDDNTLHITTSIALVPAHFRKHVWEIAIYPVYFKSFNLRDMSMQLNIAGANQEVILAGITYPARAPAAQTVSDFEAALAAAPLRIKYYPQRTDPYGTLNGTLFFKDGASVEHDMVRRGLAACSEENIAWLQQTAGSDPAAQASGQPGQSSEPQQSPPISPRGRRPVRLD